VICPVCEQPCKKIEGETPNLIKWFCPNCELLFDSLGKQVNKIGKFGGLPAWEYNEGEPEN